jgi:hypothetical protein
MTAPRVADARSLDVLNVGLMIASAAAAFAYPLEVLVVAYVFLGPLHALTELSWLHDRRYFTDSRAGALFLAVAAVAACTPAMLRSSWVPWVAPALLLTSFAVAAGLAFCKTTKGRLLVAAGGAAVALALAFTGNPMLVLFGMFVPSVVHLFVFTGAFILLGALKSRSAIGLASLVVFAACAAFVLVAESGSSRIGAGDYFREASWPFAGLAHVIAGVLPLEGGAGARALLAALRFISFITLYHYLNWFSKTRIIRWHEVSAARLATVGGLWLATLAMAWIDIRIGIALGILGSSVHVVLEFPLNHRTMAGIATELRRRYSGAPARQPAQHSARASVSRR